MGVLDPGDGLGLLFEPADEARVVGEPRVDLLHRDLPAELGIHGPPHHPEGALPDPLQEPVSAQGAAGELEGGILLEDPAVELLELRGRIDAQLLAQELLGRSKGLEGPGLPPRPIPGQHEMGPQPLPERMLDGQPLQVGQGLGVLADGESSPHEVLERGLAELLEAGHLPHQGWRVRQVAEGRPPPQLERVAQGGCGLARFDGELPAGPAEELLEPKDVDFVGFGVQHVPRGPTLDPIGPQRGAQVRHVALDGVAGGLRRLAVPHPVDQVLHGEHAVGRQEQVGQHQSLPGPAQDDGPPLLGDLQRAEEAEIEASAGDDGGLRRVAGER